MDDLFAGTAEHYARYRPRYPDQLLDDIRALVGDGQSECLVDWGCGTGEVAIPLSRTFSRVTAVDFDPEMVAVAKTKAQEAGITNIDWVVGRAEDLGIEPESCDLITAGSAFHWMDRELLASRAYAGLKPGCALALIGGGSSVWDENAEWHAIAVRCLRQHLGEPRRAGKGTYGVNEEAWGLPRACGLSPREPRLSHGTRVDGGRDRRLPLLDVVRRGAGSRRPPRGIRAGPPRGAGGGERGRRLP